MSAKYYDSFGSELKYGDYVVTLSNYENLSYKTDKSKIFEVRLDDVPVATCIVPRKNGYEWDWWDLIEAKNASGIAKIEYENH